MKRQRGFVVESLFIVAVVASLVAAAVVAPAPHDSGKKVVDSSGAAVHSSGGSAVK